MPETNFVDFLDLDTSKITFLKPKGNKHNGSQIGIRYNGETLYVKYEGVTPFGIQENYDKEGIFYGVTMQINASEEYARKAQELDEFFMKAFLQNKWGLNKNIKIEAIRGYDQHGEEGLWKRILKRPYQMRDNEREYLDYPSKMEFALYYKGDKVQTKIFNWNSEPLPIKIYRSRTAIRSEIYCCLVFLVTRHFWINFKTKINASTLSRERKSFQ